MKITKDTQTVWRLESGDVIIGKSYRDYFVRIFFKKTTPYNKNITVYNKSEMIEVYGLTEDQFDNIEKSGI